MRNDDWTWQFPGFLSSIQAARRVRSRASLPTPAAVCESRYAGRIAAQHLVFGFAPCVAILAHLTTPLIPLFLTSMATHRGDHDADIRIGNIAPGGGLRVVEATLDPGFLHAIWLV